MTAFAAGLAGLWMGAVIHRPQFGSATAGTELKSSGQRLRQEWWHD